MRLLGLGCQYAVTCHSIYNGCLASVPWFCGVGLRLTLPTGAKDHGRTCCRASHPQACLVSNAGTDVSQAWPTYGCVWWGPGRRREGVGIMLLLDVPWEPWKHWYRSLAAAPLGLWWPCPSATYTAQKNPMLLLRGPCLCCCCSGLDISVHQAGCVCHTAALLAALLPHCCAECMAVLPVSAFKAQRRLIIAWMHVQIQF